jgi:hypothetical protein
LGGGFFGGLLFGYAVKNQSYYIILSTINKIALLFV